MWRPALFIVKFFVFLFLITFALTVIWEFGVNGLIYHCTDAVFLDFLGGPKSWVHGIEVAGTSPGTGDWIARGWSMTGLKMLWFCLIALDIGLSAWLASMPLIAEERGDAQDSNPT